MSDLTFQDVLVILRLVDSVPSSDFQIEFEGTKLKVTRRTVAALGSSAGTEPIPADERSAETPASAAAPMHSVSPRADGDQAPKSDSLTARSPVELPNRIDVKSPMAGIYYAAPAPGAAPFVEVDRVVRKGDTLGIVEVMKLFTPVLSPCGGTVRAILVGNEDFVQSDQRLMIIEAVE